jgi:hypothetical protein
LRDPTGAWHFGTIAAGIKPSAGWQISENWKKDLLDPDNPPAPAIAVATKFFAWLRDTVQPLVPDLARSRIRIALPAFQNFPYKARVIKECMAGAGWDPSLIKPVREPHANIIGLMSRGKNHVTCALDGAVPFLDYGRMLGQFGLLELAHTFYINRTRSRYLKGVVLDIGAYTTDIAPLIIDLAAEISEYGDGIEALSPTSSRLGISAELDQPLFQVLLSQSHFDRSQVTFREFELLKDLLYKGETYVTLTDKGELELGSKDHQTIIDSHLDGFAQAVWATLAPVAAQHKPEWIALTGGGGCIPRLSQKIRQRIEAAGFKVASLGQGGAIRPPDTLAPAGFVSWSETGVDLTRLATALGSASVLLDIPSNSPCHTHRDWLAAQAAEAPQDELREVQCRCKGLNQDCPICDGRGYVPTSPRAGI